MEPMTIDQDRLDDLEEAMLARAFLYEPARVYREAVEEVFEALRAEIARADAAA